MRGKLVTCQPHGAHSAPALVLAPRSDRTDRSSTVQTTRIIILIIFTVCMFILIFSHFCHRLTSEVASAREPSRISVITHVVPMGLSLETDTNATNDAGAPGRAEEDLGNATPLKIWVKTPSKTPEKKTDGAANATLHPATPNTGQRTATRVTEVFALTNYTIGETAGDACDAISLVPA